MILGDTCAECGGHGAGARQLCPACEPLYADEQGLDIWRCAICGTPLIARTKAGSVLMQDGRGWRNVEGGSLCRLCDPLYAPDRPDRLVTDECERPA